MYFLSSFKRQIEMNGKVVDVDGKKGTVTWLSEQDHFVKNIGDTDTHVLFVELKELSPIVTKSEPSLGPSSK